jgi:predicted MFS family arabinose efflux permease
MHLGNRRLLATCLIGAGMLFSMVSAFTYANFRLAAVPYSLTPSQLGAIFTVYLLGLITNPISTRLVLGFGRRTTLLICVGFSLCGIGLTALPALPAIVAGMALLSGGMFVVQTLSLGFIAARIPQAKSTAVGMYVTSFYIGGAAGGILPAPLWRLFGWPGVAALLVLIALAIIGLGRAAWRE